MLQRIAKLRENSKELWEMNKDSIFWGCAAFLGAMLLAGLLRLSIIWQARSTVIQLEEGLAKEYMATSGFPGLVAASRNGKRYYYPWCAGLNRVKEANKIWFDSEKAAEAAGLTIASGCEGL
ncbi:MAG: hypothetical protein G01um101466_540 [Parcubacteria group bacterium Gr01-1014_66]|nr:MAG: hypothetical protein G01um101466_540 [Parcubacteria group bacterium Gr01-1014_66]